jgi:hypothetical protein
MKVVTPRKGYFGLGVIAIPYFIYGDKRCDIPHPTNIVYIIPG